MPCPRSWRGCHISMQRCGVRSRVRSWSGQRRTKARCRGTSPGAAPPPCSTRTGTSCKPSPVRVGRMSFDVRPCGDLSEFTRATMAIGQYFGNEGAPDRAERFSRMLPFERMHAAWDDGEIVGGAGGFPFEMSVPGGLLRCAGTTVVGVAPTHRRRGVLSAMMRAHLDDAHERGEPIAALWASEETIYGRFGYGPAAYAGDVTIPREYVEYVAASERSGRIRIVEREEALEKFPPLWEALARARPGVFIRSPEWWDLRALADPP